MKVNVVTRITIKATPEQVFTYLSDLKYHYLWNPQIREVKPVVKLKKGMTYTTNNVVLGMKLNANNKVVKFIKNREIELINETGLVHYCVNYLVVPKGKWTQVVCTTAVSVDANYFSFAKPVLKLLAQRELQTDMQALKLAVENNLQ
jgi:carbon monoxide dehydrogenase subunit G